MQKIMEMNPNYQIMVTRAVVLMALLGSFWVIVPTVRSCGLWSYLCCNILLERILTVDLNYPPSASYMRLTLCGSTPLLPMGKGPFFNKRNESVLCQTINSKCMYYLHLVTSTEECCFFLAYAWLFAYYSIICINSSKPINHNNSSQPILTPCHLSCTAAINAQNLDPKFYVLILYCVYIYVTYIMNI